MVARLKPDLENQLIEDLSSFSKDPVGWVYYSFEWGIGELEKFPNGPDEWQLDILRLIGKGVLTINEAIRIAIASGHGIGKSALVSLIILWAISTFEDTKGVVTANTATQLSTKTWAELAKWHRLFIGRDLFVLKKTSIHSVDPDHEETWRIDAIPWSDNNTEGFAGLHNQGRRIIVIFDEASAISDKIWEVVEGALTDADTEIIWAAFGNPTRNTGRFFDCFHKLKHRWKGRQIDSRTVRISNKLQIQEWIDDYGVDSDFVKVRVRGIFPNTSDRQFIPTSLVDAALGKHLNEMSYSFAPVIIGVDPAFFGDDECVIYLRQGMMSKQLGVYRKIQDDFLLAGYVAGFQDEYKADAVFVDMGYGTGVVSAGRQMGREWVIVPFGGGPTKDQGYLNKRAEMWGEMKNWLKEGAAIPNDPVIAGELAAPEYMMNLQGKILLESKKDMKKRGLTSPGRADALALTFAFNVLKKRGIRKNALEFSKTDYDPFA